MTIKTNVLRALTISALVGGISLSTNTALARCGDGAIEPAEGCDDGNTSAGDGCSAACAVETGFGCVPSLYATGVNNAGAALPSGAVDPHWTWSTLASGVGAVPAIALRNAAWPIWAPGQWVSPSAMFGNELTTQPDTFWFQNVNIPAAFAGALTFPIVVSCDNECEVFVNGVSYGGHNTFVSTATITIPASAFVAGPNTVRVRLREYGPGTPRGILIYPGGGGILSQCTRRCMTAAECDDGIACTDGACIGGACSFLPTAAGTACRGGVCNGSALVPMCIGCIDTSLAGTDSGCVAAAPHCRTSGTGAPVCERCIDSGMSGIDLGCASATPYCVAGSAGNSCVACLAASDCNDSNVCTTDACTAGACTSTPVAVGTTCAAGVCSAAGACVGCVDTAADASIDSGCNMAAPLCLGSGAAATCNACADTAIAGTDLGCNAMSPVCGSIGGAAVCVGCLAASDCADGNACTTEACLENRCQLTSLEAGTPGTCPDMNVCTGPMATMPNACVQCVSDAQCSGATAFCNTTTNLCGPCTRDFGGAGDGAACPEMNPLCALTGPMAGVCGRCSTNADCAGNPAGALCDTMSGACGTACTVDSDCAGTEWCPASRVCAPKVPNGMSVPMAGPADGTCTMTIGTRTCISGVCFEADDLCGLPNGETCTGASVCRSAICAPNGLCGACDSNDDCDAGICNVATGACFVPDGGMPDAGRPDAGSRDSDTGPMTADAGGDAGESPGGIAGGACGCTVNTTKSTSGILAMLGMLALVMMRRRRAR
jgi:cysteine-rich repeat protein